MRLRTALRPWVLCRRWHPRPGITRTFVVAETGKIVVLMDILSGVYADSFVIEPQIPIRRPLVRVLDGVAGRLLTRAHLMDAGWHQFESSLSKHTYTRREEHN